VVFKNPGLEIKFRLVSWKGTVIGKLSVFVLASEALEKAEIEVQTNIIYSVYTVCVFV